MRIRARVIGGAVLVVTSVITLAGARQSQAPPAAPSGLILGQVLDAQTNRPIGRAVVTLAAGRTAQVISLPGLAGSQQVLADSNGRFLFRSLAAGSYTFAATATGYLTGSYGQRRPEGAGQPFDLQDGQRTGDVVIRLWRAATVGGSVVDDGGNPVGNVGVQIVRQTLVGGRATLSPQLIYTSTDDRGVYRKSNLPPGDYLVAVVSRITATPIQFATLDRPASDALRASGAFQLADTTQSLAVAVRVGDFLVQTSQQNTLAGVLPLSVLPDGRVRTYVTTFHPSASSPAGASVVPLDVGDERTSIDLQLRPTSLVALTGTVTAPDGSAAGLAVHLIPAYAVHTLAERTFEAAIAVTDRNGRFVFPAVAAGAYVVEVWRKPSAVTSLLAPASSEPALWAEQTVTVGTAPVSVAMTLRPGSIISGRIVLEGTTTPPRSTVFQPMLGAWFQPPWPLAYAQGPLPETRISATWEFTREGSPPGPYPAVMSSSSFSPPTGWYFKSATHQGRDLLTTPLVLNGQDVSDVVMTFTNRPTSLSGVVADRNGQHHPSASVLVFPVDYETWIANGMPALAARAVATSQTGTYAFGDLRPGEFLVVASDFDVLDRWQDPEVLRTLASGATRVTLVTGAQNKQDLRSR